MKTKFTKLYIKAEDVDLPDEYDVWRNMTPEDVLADIAIKREINHRAQEVLLFVGWNDAGLICAIDEVAVGSSGGISGGTIREPFQLALLSNATSIATLHNHPSGKAVPSSNDIDRCRKMIEIGKHLRIKLIEDVVIDYDGNYDSIMRAMLREDLKE